MFAIDLGNREFVVGVSSDGFVGFESNIHKAKRFGTIEAAHGYISDATFPDGSPIVYEVVPIPVFVTAPEESSRYARPNWERVR